MISIYSYLFCSLGIRCLRHVKNLIDVLWRVLILWRQSTNFLIPPPTMVPKFKMILLMTIIQREVLCLICFHDQPGYLNMGQPLSWVLYLIYSQYSSKNSYQNMMQKIETQQPIILQQYLIRCARETRLSPWRRR